MNKLDNHIKGIRGWLNKQGYPLEMTTARVLNLYGLGFVQGSNYEDSDTEEAREIDILARAYAYGNNTLLLEGIIECKYSELPLVAFTYRPELQKSPLDFWIPCNNSGAIVLNKLKEDNIAQTLPIFLQQTPIAYSIKQALYDEEETKESKKKTKDNIFEAIMTVTKASYYQSKLYNKEDTRLASEDGKTLKMATYLGIPTIIVRAPLYICYLDNEGEIAIEPRTSVLLEWVYPQIGRIMTIRVIQEIETANYAKSMAKSTEILNAQHKNYF